MVFLLSHDDRARFHALQAITLGTAWAAALYAGALTTPRVTQAIFVLGGLAWIVLLIATAFGRDVHLPVIGRYLQRLARARGEEVATPEA
jgi:uncharacterized membrane protein